jgi:hypothetical protein
MTGFFNMLGVGLLWLILIPLTAGLGLIPFALWAYFVFADSNKRIQKSFAKLEDTLIEGEGLRAPRKLQDRLIAIEFKVY